MLSQLAEVVQARSQVERMIIQLTGDLQAVCGRIDTQASEIVLLSKDLKDRLLKCEQDNRMAVSISNLFQYGHFAVFFARNLLRMK